MAHVRREVALAVLERLEGIAPVGRIAAIVESMPLPRGLIFETSLDDDAPLPVDFALRCAGSELEPMLSGCARPEVAAEFAALVDLGAYRMWLEFDTSTTAPGVPSLFAQYRDPRLAAAALRLLPGAEAVPDLDGAEIRHLGKMYGRSPADVRVVWSGLDLDRIGVICSGLGLSDRVAETVGHRPGALHLALAFSPAVEPRFGVEWMVRRLPAWEVPDIAPAARELLALWRRLPREVPGLGKAEVSHLKWTFEADRVVRKVYLYVD